MSNDNLEMMRNKTPCLLAIADATKSLGGISQWTLRKHIASGRLRVVRIGRRVFLDVEEIERIRREGLPSLGSGPQTPVDEQQNPQTEARLERKR